VQKMEDDTPDMKCDHYYGCGRPHLCVSAEAFEANFERSRATDGQSVHCYALR